MDKKNNPSDEDQLDACDGFEPEGENLHEYFRVGGHEEIGDGCYRKNIKGQD